MISVTVILIFVSDKIKRVKVVFIIIALVIAFLSLVVSHGLVKDLSTEETKKMEVWSEAMKAFSHADNNTDLALVLKVLNGNTTIPVIVVDKIGTIQSCRNIEVPLTNKDSFLQNKVVDYRNENHKIRIYFQSIITNNMADSSDYIDIYYGESLMLKRLAIYPYVQLTVVLIFVLVIIFALLNMKKAEQNKVWVGLSKETAHQLGTPISSLLAWLEILTSRYSQDDLIKEMGSDVSRLQLIADRFSKIGSKPEPQLCNLTYTLENVVDYMSKRCSSKVKIIRDYSDASIYTKLNSSLFEWVIENLFKNAIDAMDGRGTITISVIELSRKVVIDVSDTGKGLSKSKFRTIFKPGYTTKKRGWGLGLSLVKRIVEEYHQGKIFVKSSELNKGTTIRIELKK